MSNRPKDLSCDRCGHCDQSLQRPHLQGDGPPRRRVASLSQAKPAEQLWALPRSHAEFNCWAEQASKWPAHAAA